MGKKSKSDLRRIHLTMDRAQLDRLEFFFGRTQAGVSGAIRIAIAKLLAEHEAEAKAILEKTENPAETV